jgi:hypothetical protein
MRSLLNTTVILESITHLEDLPVNEFIKTVESLKDKVVTEKLDGANLWFGLDESGLFTSREGKSPKKGRFYDVTDYPVVANYNSFRAVHLALEQVEDTIKKHLQEGDMVEIEVLYGRQPNTVTYGVANKNFIVVLRGVNGTPQERVDALSKALKHKTVNVKSDVVSSSDGNELETTLVPMLWEFVQVKPIDSSTIDTKEVMVRLDALKKYVNAESESLPGKTNREVIELSLTSVPKAERAEAKTAREETIAYVQSEFKNPIKELLLTKFVRKIKPFLQDDDLHPSEDIGVEGVVVRDPVSGTMTKIVDKDVFTAINTFNSAVRAEVAGLVRTTDQDAAIEMRGGSFGQAKIRIADILGAKELALSSGLRRFVLKFKGDSAQSTATAIADSLNITSLPSIRNKISAILKNSLTEVDSILSGFKQDAGTYKLKLKTGKEIGITPEVMKRTLTAFAETKKDIATVNARVVNSRTPADLVMALYGSTIESLFAGDTDMKESFSFIRSIIEDEGGAVDVSAAGTPPAAMTGTTTSSSIAPVPFKMMKGKVITRRQRSFVKIKKFAPPQAEGQFSSLLKAMTEDAAVDKMQFAKDVDDKASAQNDVEFKKLRNNVAMGGNVNQVDVTQYLDKAHELNDEVDTVTFGMETDSGEVVKVYVNAAEADNFEAVLSELLGKEDDIAEVINNLADQFDIVDVEWPASLQQAVDGNAETSIDLPTTDEPEVAPEEPEVEVEPEVEPEVAPEEPDEEPDLSISADDEDDAPASDEDTPVDDDDEAEQPADDLDTTSDADAEQPADDLDTTSDDEQSDDEDTDKPKDESPKAGGLPKRNKKQKTKTEESMQTFGDKFLERFLNEAKKNDKKRGDEEEEEDPAVLASREKHAGQVDKLLKVVTRPADRAIITLLLALGVPLKALLIQRAELRRSVEAAGDIYRQNGSFRMWVRKFLMAMQDDESVNESETFSRKLNNPQQLLIYNVMKALGMPEAVESAYSGMLLASIRSKYEYIKFNSKARVNLNAIADILGVAGSVKNMSKDDVNESVLTENIGDAEFAVTDFLQTLGIDVTKSMSIQRQLATPQVRTNMLKLAANTNLMKRFGAVSSMIQDKLDKPGQEPTYES